jgi:hypothetical protein
MDRFLLSMAVLACFLLLAFGMWRGWRRKAREQSARFAPFPAVPDSDALGAAVLDPINGLYVASTVSGRWQERIITRGMGLRTPATLCLYRRGVVVERSGATSFFIPADSIRTAALGRGMLGKVMGTDSLLVLTWQLEGELIDSGFLADDVGVYPQWLDAIDAVGGDRNDSGKSNGNEISGGAR